MELISAHLAASPSTSLSVPLFHSFSLYLSLSLSCLHDDDEALLSSRLLSLFVFVDFVLSYVLRFRALIMELVIPSPTLNTPPVSLSPLTHTHTLLLIVN